MLQYIVPNCFLIDKFTTICKYNFLNSEIDYRQMFFFVMCLKKCVLFKRILIKIIFDFVHLTHKHKLKKKLFWITFL